MHKDASGDQPGSLNHRKLDEVFHSRLRLAIAAALLPVSGMDFISLRDLVGATDGNMTTHLKRLEDAGYISVHKEFRKKKPLTTISLTDSGRKAFSDYIYVLDSFIHHGGTQGR